MDNPKEAAKKMFFNFACSHCYMWHDGVEEEYDRYGIEKAEEAH